MHKQIALAYAIAGLAVAAALLVVVGSTTGWFADQVATDAAPVEPAAPPAPSPAPSPKPAATRPEPVIPATSQAIEPPAETIYVDEPAPQKRSHHDDDDDDDDSHERESEDD